MRVSTGVPKALVDANVLYSRTLRDWIILLSLRDETPFFYLRWSEDIMVETLYHLRKKHPYWDEPQIGEIRRRIEDSLGSEKITGYQVDKDLDYTDPHDAHVHAAAVHGQVQYVVSNDKGFGDFTAAHDETLDYEHYTADGFLVLIDDNSAPTVRQVLIEQIDYYRQRGGSFNLVKMLQSAGAPKFAERIGCYLRSPAIAVYLSPAE